MSSRYFLETSCDREKGTDGKQETPAQKLWEQMALLIRTLFIWLKYRKKGNTKKISEISLTMSQYRKMMWFTFI